MFESRVEVIRRMARVGLDEGIPPGEMIFLVADPASAVGELVANVLGLEGVNEKSRPLVVPLVGEQARAFVDAVCPETVEAITSRPEGTIAVAVVNQADEIVVVYMGDPGDVPPMGFSGLPRGTA
jgi:hypothetical protein